MADADGDIRPVEGGSIGEVTGEIEFRLDDAQVARELEEFGKNFPKHLGHITRLVEAELRKMRQAIIEGRSGSVAEYHKLLRELQDTRKGITTGLSVSASDLLTSITANVARDIGAEAPQVFDKIMIQVRGALEQSADRILGGLGRMNGLDARVLKNVTGAIQKEGVLIKDALNQSMGLIGRAHDDFTRALQQRSRTAAADLAKSTQDIDRQLALQAAAVVRKEQLQNRAAGLGTSRQRIREELDQLRSLRQDISAMGENLDTSEGQRLLQMYAVQRGRMNTLRAYYQVEQGGERLKPLNLPFFNKENVDESVEAIDDALFRMREMLEDTRKEAIAVRVELDRLADLDITNPFNQRLLKGARGFRESRQISAVTEDLRGFQTKAQTFRELAEIAPELKPLIRQFMVEMVNGARNTLIQSNLAATGPDGQLFRARLPRVATLDQAFKAADTVSGEGGLIASLERRQAQISTTLLKTVQAARLEAANGANVAKDVIESWSEAGAAVTNTVSLLTNAFDTVEDEAKSRATRVQALVTQHSGSLTGLQAALNTVEAVVLRTQAQHQGALETVKMLQQRLARGGLTQEERRATRAELRGDPDADTVRGRQGWLEYENILKRTTLGLQSQRALLREAIEVASAFTMEEIGISDVPTRTRPEGASFVRARRDAERRRQERLREAQLQLFGIGSQTSAGDLFDDEEEERARFLELAAQERARAVRRAPVDLLRQAAVRRADLRRGVRTAGSGIPALGGTQEAEQQLRLDIATFEALSDRVEELFTLGTRKLHQQGLTLSQLDALVEQQVALASRILASNQRLGGTLPGGVAGRIGQLGDLNAFGGLGARRSLPFLRQLASGATAGQGVPLGGLQGLLSRGTVSPDIRDEIARLQKAISVGAGPGGAVKFDQENQAAFSRLNKMTEDSVLGLRGMGDLLVDLHLVRQRLADAVQVASTQPELGFNVDRLNRQQEALTAQLRAGLARSGLGPAQIRETIKSALGVDDTSLRMARAAAENIRLRGEFVEQMQRLQASTAGLEAKPAFVQKRDPTQEPNLRTPRFAPESGLTLRRLDAASSPLVRSRARVVRTLEGTYTALLRQLTRDFAREPVLIAEILADKGEEVIQSEYRRAQGDARRTGLLDRTRVAKRAFDFGKIPGQDSELTQLIRRAAEDLEPDDFDADSTRSVAAALQRAAERQGERLSEVLQDAVVGYLLDQADFLRRSNFSQVAATALKRTVIRPASTRSLSQPGPSGRIEEIAQRYILRGGQAEAEFIDVGEDGLASPLILKPQFPAPKRLSERSRNQMSLIGGRIRQRTGQINALRDAISDIDAEQTAIAAYFAATGRSIDDMAEAGRAVEEALSSVLPADQRAAFLGSSPFATPGAFSQRFNRRAAIERMNALRSRVARVVPKVPLQLGPGPVIGPELPDPNLRRLTDEAAIDDILPRGGSTVHPDMFMLQAEINQFRRKAMQKVTEAAVDQVVKDAKSIAFVGSASLAGRNTATDQAALERLFHDAVSRTGRRTEDIEDLVLDTSSQSSIGRVLNRLPSIVGRQRRTFAAVFDTPRPRETRQAGGGEKSLAIAREVDELIAVYEGLDEDVARDIGAMIKEGKRARVFIAQNGQIVREATARELDEARLIEEKKRGDYPQTGPRAVVRSFRPGAVEPFAAQVLGDPTVFVERFMKSIVAGNAQAAAAAVRNMGENAGEAFEKGWSSTFQGTRDEIEQGMKLLLGGIKDVWDIRSPSRVTDAIGAAVGQGFLLGYDRVDVARKILASIRAMLADVRQAANAGLMDLFEGRATVVQGAIRDIDDKLGSLGAALGTVSPGTLAERQIRGAIRELMAARLALLDAFKAEAASPVTITDKAFDDAMADLSERHEQIKRLEAERKRLRFDEVQGEIRNIAAPRKAELEEGLVSLQSEAVLLNKALADGILGPAQSRAARARLLEIENGVKGINQEYRRAETLLGQLIREEEGLAKAVAQQSRGREIADDVMQGQLNFTRATADAHRSYTETIKDSWRQMGILEAVVKRIGTPRPITPLGRVDAAGDDVRGPDRRTRSYLEQRVALAQLQERLQNLNAEQAELEVRMSRGGKVTNEQMIAWKRYTAEVRAAEREIERVQNTMKRQEQFGRGFLANARDAVRQLRRELFDLDGVNRRVTRGGGVFGGSLRSGIIGGLIGGATLRAGNALERGFTGLGDALVGFNARIESAQVGLSFFIQDAEKSQRLINDMIRFSASTPFNLEDLLAGTKRLLAMGVAAEEVLPTFRTLGAAVAAVAGGDTDVLNRVILAYGQIRAKNVLMSQDLRQLAEAGIPAFRILQEELNLTGEQVFDIGRQHIDAVKGVEALERGMRRMYGGALIAQMDTFEGRARNFRDILSILVGRIGAPFTNQLKLGLEQLGNLLQEPGVLRGAEELGRFIGVIGQNIRGMLNDAREGFLVFARMLPTEITNIGTYMKQLQVHFSELSFDPMRVFGGELPINLGRGPQIAARIDSLRREIEAGAAKKAQESAKMGVLALDVQAHIERVQIEEAKIKNQAEMEAQTKNRLEDIFKDNIPEFTVPAKLNLKGEVIKDAIIGEDDLIRQLSGPQLEALQAFMAAVGANLESDASTGRPIAHIGAVLREAFIDELSKLDDNPSVEQLQAAIERLFNRLQIPGQFSDQEIIKLGQAFFELSDAQTKLIPLQKTLSDQQAEHTKLSKEENDTLAAKRLEIERLTDAREKEGRARRDRIEDIGAETEDINRELRLADRDFDLRIRKQEDWIKDRHKFLDPILEGIKAEQEAAEQAVEDLERAHDVVDATLQTDLDARKNAIKDAEERYDKLDAAAAKQLKSAQAAQKLLADRHSAENEAFDRVTRQQGRVIADMQLARGERERDYKDRIDEAADAERAHARIIKNATLDQREKVRSQQEEIDAIEDKYRLELRAKNASVRGISREIAEAERAFNRRELEFAQGISAARRAGNTEEVARIREERDRARQEFDELMEGQRAARQVAQDEYDRIRERSEDEATNAKEQLEDIQRVGGRRLDQLQRESEYFANNREAVTEERDAVLAGYDEKIRVAEAFSTLLGRQKEDLGAIQEAELSPVEARIAEIEAVQSRLAEARATQIEVLAAEEKASQDRFDKAQAQQQIEMGGARARLEFANGQVTLAEKSHELFFKQEGEKLEAIKEEKEAYDRLAQDRLFALETERLELQNIEGDKQRAFERRMREHNDEATALERQHALAQKLRQDAIDRTNTDIEQTNRRITAANEEIKVLQTREQLEKDAAERAKTLQEELNRNRIVNAPDGTARSPQDVIGELIRTTQGPSADSFARRLEAAQAAARSGRIGPIKEIATQLVRILDQQGIDLTPGEVLQAIWPADPLKMQVGVDPDVLHFLALLEGGEVADALGFFGHPDFLNKIREATLGLRDEKGNVILEGVPEVRQLIARLAGLLPDAERQKLLDITGVTASGQIDEKSLERFATGSTELEGAGKELQQAASDLKFAAEALIPESVKSQPARKAISSLLDFRSGDLSEVLALVINPLLGIAANNRQLSGGEIDKLLQDQGSLIQVLNTILDDPQSRARLTGLAATDPASFAALFKQALGDLSDEGERNLFRRLMGAGLLPAQVEPWTLGPGRGQTTIGPATSSGLLPIFEAMRGMGMLGAGTVSGPLAGLATDVSFGLPPAEVTAGVVNERVVAPTKAELEKLTPIAQAAGSAAAAANVAGLQAGLGIGEEGENKYGAAGRLLLGGAGLGVLSSEAGLEQSSLAGSAAAGAAVAGMATAFGLGAEQENKAGRMARELLGPAGLSWLISEESATGLGLLGKGVGESVVAGTARGFGIGEGRNSFGRLAGVAIGPEGLSYIAASESLGLLSGAGTLAGAGVLKGTYSGLIDGEGTGIEGLTGGIKALGTLAGLNLLAGYEEAVREGATLAAQGAASALAEAQDTAMQGLGLGTRSATSGAGIAGSGAVGAFTAPRGKPLINPLRGSSSSTYAGHGNAVDLNVASGDLHAPVRAQADGRVALVSFPIRGDSGGRDVNSGYGNYIVINHPQLGIATLYAHLSGVKGPAVTKHQEVRQGQVIGYIGSTGHSTGPHLHNEVRSLTTGGRLPPLQFIDLGSGGPVGYGEGHPVGANVPLGDVPGGSAPQSSRAGVARKLIQEMFDTVTKSGGDVGRVVSGFLSGEGLGDLSGFEPFAASQMKVALETLQLALQVSGLTDPKALLPILRELGVAPTETETVMQQFMREMFPQGLPYMIVNGVMQGLDEAKISAAWDQFWAAHPGLREKAFLEESRRGRRDILALEEIDKVVEDRTLMPRLASLLGGNRALPEIDMFLKQLEGADANTPLRDIVGLLMTRSDHPILRDLASILSTLGRSLEAITVGQLRDLLSSSDAASLITEEALAALGEGQRIGDPFVKGILDALLTAGLFPDDTTVETLLSTLGVPTTPLGQRLRDILATGFGGRDIDDLRHIFTQDGQLRTGLLQNVETQPGVRNIPAQVREAAAEIRRLARESITTTEDGAQRVDPAVTRFLTKLRTIGPGTPLSAVLAQMPELETDLSKFGEENVPHPLFEALRKLATDLPNATVDDLLGLLFGGEGFEPVEQVDALKQNTDAVDANTAALLGARTPEEIDTWKAILREYREIAPDVAETAEAATETAAAVGAIPGAGTAGSPTGIPTSGLPSSGLPGTAPADVRTEAQRNLDEARKRLVDAEGKVAQLESELELAIARGDRESANRIIEQLKLAEAARDQAKQMLEELEKNTNEQGVKSDEQIEAERRYRARLEFGIDRYQKRAAEALARGDIAEYNAARARVKQLEGELERLDREAESLEAGVQKVADAGAGQELPLHKEMEKVVQDMQSAEQHTRSWEEALNRAKAALLGGQFGPGDPKGPPPDATQPGEVDLSMQIINNIFQANDPRFVAEVLTDRQIAAQREQGDRSTRNGRAI